MTKSDIEKSSADRNRKSTTGFVYFVLCDPMEAVKIGFTRHDPARRTAGLQGSCPAPLRLTAFFPGTLDDERRLHVAFSFLHIHGEWFRYRGKLYELIDFLSHNRTRKEASREAFEAAVWDVLFQGYAHEDEPEVCAEIYARTGDWQPFAHILGQDR